MFVASENEYYTLFHGRGKREERREKKQKERKEREGESCSRDREGGDRWG